FAPQPLVCKELVRGVDRRLMDIESMQLRLASLCPKTAAGRSQKRSCAAGRFQNAVPGRTDGPLGKELGQLRRRKKGASGLSFVAVVEREVERNDHGPHTTRSRNLPQGDTEPTAILSSSRWTSASRSLRAT